MSDMLTGEQVKKYFANHPEAVKCLEGIEWQNKIEYQLKEGEELIKRPLAVDDVEFITLKGWEGQAGIFAWYYPCDIPHYCKIGEASEWPIESEAK